MDWQRIQTPPDCDSLGGETCCPDSFVVAMDTLPYIDTVHVIVENGSIEVASFICGNINGTGGVNVADLTYLVEFLFFGGSDPQPMASANVNCQGGDVPNVADLTYMVTFLFESGPAPCDC